jgi:hypothetical protein
VNSFDDLADVLSDARREIDGDEGTHEKSIRSRRSHVKCEALRALPAKLGTGLWPLSQEEPADGPSSAGPELLRPEWGGKSSLRHHPLGGAAGRSLARGLAG